MHLVKSIFVHFHNTRVKSTLVFWGTRKYMIRVYGPYQSLEEP